MARAYAGIADRRRWPYLIAGLILGMLLAFPAVLLALMSAGAGHGDYILARWLFPWPMLLARVSGVDAGMLVLGLLQFPLYGLLVGDALARQRYRMVAAVALLHLLAAAYTLSPWTPFPDG